MRVIVTGGSGLLGSYTLAELVEAGHEVVCLSRTAPSTAGMEHVPGDILDRPALDKAFAGADAVVHLAACVMAPGMTADRLTQVNAVGTATLLQAAADAGVGAVIFGSSAAAGGLGHEPWESVAYLPIDEAYPARPRDVYGLSKLLGEGLCAHYSELHALRTIALRFTSCLVLDRDGAERAVGNAGWSGSMSVDDVWAMYRRRMFDPAFDTERKMLWSSVDARDVGRSIRLALESDTTGHHVMYVSAETCSPKPSAQLVADHYPDAQLRHPLDGFASLVSAAKAAELIGFEPAFSWRDSDFAAWAQSRA
jgi:nucleoside-diphosphate-sugar epimerase